MKIRKITEAMGAEVVDADIASLGNDAFEAVYRAFIEGHVLVIREQQLEIPDWLAFCRRFGMLRPHINKSRRHPAHPELLLLDNLAVDGKAADPRMVMGGAVWHSDLGYENEPAKATGLYAIHLPSSGGDTLFKNMHAAYDTLPPDLRRRIEG